MTRSPAARSLAVAAVTAAALLVPASAPGTALYALNGKTQHGTTFAMTVESGHLKPHSVASRVLLRCTNGHGIAAHFSYTRFTIAHYESVYNSLGDHYVDYHAHATNNGYVFSMAVTVVRRHNGVAEASGTFNVSYNNRGVPCDTGGNVSFTASSHSG